MKRKRLFILAALFPVLQLMQAQTSYEAAALLDTELNGTSRFVGMGGAMSALGADMSTMSTNPAATALYRRWDVALSYGGHWKTTDTHSNKGAGRAFSSYRGLDNVGTVIANQKSNTDILRFINFGFNYRNVQRLGGKMVMNGVLDGLSQTEQMALQALGNGNVDASFFDPLAEANVFDRPNEHYVDARYGWLTLLGAQAHLMGLTSQRLDDGSVENGAWCIDSKDCEYSESLYGGIDAYDFNLSFNILDAIYLGATFTTYDVDRAVESVYNETFDNGIYILKNFYRTVGTGYDFKFGAIVRPFSESSFRVGLSVATPTVYSLCDLNSAIIESCVSYAMHTIDTFGEEGYGDDYTTKYTMVSPGRCNVSLGGTIGKSWALGTEYEYIDYGGIKLYDDLGNAHYPMNEHTDACFKGKHTLRLGVEKCFSSFYTRLGYNFQMGGYSKEAFKMIPVQSVQTNTAFANINSICNYTCGIGYRGDVFYADASLLYNVQKADFYPFDESALQPVLLRCNNVKGALTLGMRF